MRRHYHKKRKARFEEYPDPKDLQARKDALGNFHTEFSNASQAGTSQRTIRMPMPPGVSLSKALPLPGSTDSPTPKLDWVLSQPNLPFRVFDGDIELEEMEDCELEALGLIRYKSRLQAAASEGPQSPQKKKKTHSTHPIEFWTPYIDTYVDEMLRLEGLGGEDATRCSNYTCLSNPVNHVFRCIDCWSDHLFCAPCIVSSHRCNPFHRVERWTGEYFQKITLKDIGLRVQLGHTDSNGVCEVPISAFNNDFTIISDNGIHSISLDYCGCATAQPKMVQLLRAQLFPSTTSDPKTAATFNVLKLFQLLSFNSKISGHEFYKTLVRITDNTGTKPPPDRYPVFLRIVREWRHVRLLKRMGRGHDPSGVKGTKEGECAVLCPACPHPGVNLPDNWKESPESRIWLYSLFVAIDANFRLKRMNVSSTERDPPLNHGYAYMVENNKFKAYLEEYDHKIPDEKSNCNNHDAIKSASARGGNGTAASGLGTAECSRHDMKRPLAVGDLQKGERYVNMDYFFLSTIACTLLMRIVVSYDIACQWWCNLVKRCHVYPSNAVSTLSDLVLVFLIPKFHLPAHISKCQTSFSFNFTPRVGRTDGESPERGWSAANGIASSTKEMGPGSRSDTLDDHFGDYNWRKIIGIADTFIRKAKEAISERQEHVESFIEFDAALPDDATKGWTKVIQAWERDPTQLNPYVVERGTLITDSDVRLRLAAEEAAALSRGEAISLHDDVTPSLFMFQGLQLQETQRRLVVDASNLGPHSTSLQQTKILERSTSLKRRIDSWITIQNLYMPTVAALRSRHDALATSPVAVQDIKLFLPSEVVGSIVCSQQLLKHEWDYRYAQAEETLNDLRGFLLLRSHMYKSKDTHSRGQRQQTRSLKLLADVEDKIKFSTSTYRLIRQSLEALDPVLLHVSWKNILRPLTDKDVAGLTSMDDSKSEGRKRLTWIWKVHGTGDNADECTQAALRIEWCKARARAHRWQEECLLLAEEMRRVLSFFEWSAARWDTRGAESSMTAVNEDQTISGKVSYAKRQAAMCREIKAHCEREWHGLSGVLTTMDSRDAYVMVECH